MNPAQIQKQNNDEVDRLTLVGQHLSTWQILKFVLCFKLIRSACRRIITRAYERGLIQSFQFHELIALVDRATSPTKH